LDEGVLMNRLGWGVLGLLLLTLAGCGGAGGIPRSPGQGGNAWVEVSSAHFRVVSDLDPADARQIADQLEQGVYAIEHAAFEHARVALEPTTVVVFRDEADFHAFEPALARGTFTRQLPSDLEPSKFMVLFGELTPESRIACLHELTHDLFDRNFGPAPPWLQEGWAEYFSTIEIDNGHVRVGAGLPHVGFTLEAQAYSGRAPDGSPVFVVPIDEVTPPSELLKLDRQKFYEFAFNRTPSTEAQDRGRALYLGSWAFVHLLRDRDSQLNARYVRFLNIVRDEQVPAAWSQAFAGVSDSDLDRELRRYLARGELVVYDSPLAVPTAAALKMRALRDDEVHVLWGRLASKPGDGSRIADAQFDIALREAPESAEAHYFRGLSALRRRRFPEAEHSLLLAAQLAPSDPRYLLAIVFLRSEQRADPDARVQADDSVMQAALPLVPLANSPMQLRILAEIYRDLSDLPKALAFAERAVALNPIGSSELDTEASLLNDLGRFDEALHSQRAAVAFLPEKVKDDAMQDRLRQYEQKAKGVR
jgi:tetratricopeptide (TPR) repeat protein